MLGSQNASHYLGGVGAVDTELCVMESVLTLRRVKSSNFLNGRLFLISI